MINKLLGIVFIGSFILFLIINIPSPVKIQGDGVFYYSWLHSVVFDFDIDFKNQLKHFSAYDFYSNKFISENITTKTGLVPNPYPFGTAILWAPFILLAHILSVLINFFVNSDFFISNGFSFLYIFLVNLASWTFGSISFFVIFKILKYYFSEKISFISTFFIWLGTPWIYYQFFEPSMSHMASLFCVSIFLYLAIKFFNNKKISGICFFIITFLMISVRWQNILFVLVLFLLILWFKRKETKGKRLLILMALAFVLFSIIQSLSWKIIYGDFFLIPQGNNFILSGFHGIHTLFSNNRGLFFWSPILLLSLPGFLVWKNNKEILFLIGGSFLAQWIINSSLSDIGGGDAFGARRFIETIPFLSIMLASAFGYFKKRIFLFLLILLAFWSLAFLFLYHYDLISRSGNINIFQIISKIN